jgi:hypothetical protein
MPGYRALSSSVTGTAAENAREAESLRRDGDSQNAVRLLEEAIAASQAVRAEMPGWLCGRLAALYRTMARYDDEVLLLEQYRESQSSEEACTRFDARLSKARTIAERKRRTENGALASVTKVLGARHRRRLPAAAVRSGATAAPAVPEALGAHLVALLADAALGNDEARLAATLGEVASSARAAGVPANQLVAALRSAFRFDASTDGAALRDPRYSAALLRLLAVYFDEADR